MAFSFLERCVELARRADALAALELDLVDDRGDGGLEADVVAASDAMARGAAEHDQHALADAGAEWIDGDQRLRAFASVARERLDDEEAQADQRRILLGGPHVADDRAEQHQRVPSARADSLPRRHDFGAPGTSKSSTMPTIAASNAKSPS